MCPSTQWLVAPPVAERGATPSFTFESFVRTPDSWGSLPWPIKAVFFHLSFQKGGSSVFWTMLKKNFNMGRARQTKSIYRSHSYISFSLSLFKTPLHLYCCAILHCALLNCGCPNEPKLQANCWSFFRVPRKYKDGTQIVDVSMMGHKLTIIMQMSINANHSAKQKYYISSNLMILANHWQVVCSV